MSQTPNAVVLLIEDDDVFREACLQVLTRAGFAVEAIADPRLAAERVKTRRFGAVVSDIRMPNEDGISVLREVRQLDPDMPFVLMTGAPTMETAVSAVEYGALRYLQKPFDIDVLVAVVREALQRRPAPPVDDVRRAARFQAALDSLWMAYQPIVRWSSRTAWAYEALLRCSSPEVANPMEFIELAEQLGRVHELGRAVRAAVARELQARQGPVCFVNLHPSDLEDPELYDPRAPLSRFASQVVLEVTERANLAHWDDLPMHVRRLRALGYRVAIDDLGAGYAGLTTFARVEPEFVKLDGSLIRNMDTSQTQRRIVKSVVAMAREMGIEVVAEAIETLAERRVLTGMGLDLMQGYFFARPSRPFVEVPPAALADDQLLATA